MPVDPKRRKIILRYEKGTARMALGVGELLFGPITTSGRWKRPGTAGQDGRGKVPYGRAQRTLCGAGKAVSIHMKNGDVWTVRITGPDKKFNDMFLARSVVKDDVIRIVTPRGTKYGEEVDVIASV
jgi:hypothetical protein